ncbi:unnamed protein product, partial [Discosporangium mesarthrocarpum]
PSKVVLGGRAGECKVFSSGGEGVGREGKTNSRAAVADHPRQELPTMARHEDPQGKDFAAVNLQAEGGGNTSTDAAAVTVVGRVELGQGVPLPPPPPMPEGGRRNSAGEGAAADVANYLRQEAAASAVAMMGENSCRRGTCAADVERGAPLPIMPTNAAAVAAAAAAAANLPQQLPPPMQPKCGGRQGNGERDEDGDGNNAAVVVASDHLQREAPPTLERMSPQDDSGDMGEAATATDNGRPLHCQRG